MSQFLVSVPTCHVQMIDKSRDSSFMAWVVDMETIGSGDTFMSITFEWNPSKSIESRRAWMDRMEKQEWFFLCGFIG